MKRRDFMRLTATTGGMLACGGVKLALAQQAYSGPFWLFVEARGGWDPTSFCDPKGSGLGPNGDINNYDQNDVGQIGNIRYAPPPGLVRERCDAVSEPGFLRRTLPAPGRDKRHQLSNQFARSGAYRKLDGIASTELPQYRCADRLGRGFRSSLTDGCEQQLQQQQDQRSNSAFRCARR